MVQTRSVQSFLDGQPFSRFQQRIFALCFAIVLFDGFDTGAVGFIAPALAKEWGVSKPALAPVLTAALFGLATGALVAGPLADRFGRKVVLTVSVFVFGTASLASGWSGSVDQLAIMRAVTGLGLGAALPNAVTLMNEYCPTQRRSTLTNALVCGFPLGAALGGFLAAWMIPAFGWRSVLILGGVAPVLLTLLLVMLLPESARYLLTKSNAGTRVREILSRVHASARTGGEFTAPEAVPSPGAKSGIAVLFSGSYLVGSLMLWVAYFMGLAIFYAMINWLPILLRDSGLEPQQATLISSLFSLGGIFAVFAGWLMDRFNANRIVAAFYALTAVAIYLLGQAAGQVGALIVIVFLAGVVMNTAQTSLPALAAAFYPTEGRATGVAWMMGIGRFGGIFGSFLVGELTRRQLGFGPIFTVLAVPGVLAALALLLKPSSAVDSATAPAVLEGDAVRS